MRSCPKGGLIGKSVGFLRKILALKISLYAAGASFFIALAVFPGLLLLLGLLRYTPLEVERLGEFLALALPETLSPGVEELVLLTYDASSGTALGISAVATLWSASRGIYGLIGGLNAVYGVRETRSYLHRRWVSLLCTFVFLLALLLSLGLHVFGGGLVRLPVLWLLAKVIDLRRLLLLAVQALLFAAMFMVLPNRRGCFREGLPGALLGASGWLIFSDRYSVYVERYARLTRVYGSVYAVALSMLWLYCCVSIVFYGALVNRLLKERSLNNL